MKPNDLRKDLQPRAEQLGISVPMLRYILALEDTVRDLQYRVAKLEGRTDEDIENDN